IAPLFLGWKIPAAAIPASWNLEVYVRRSQIRGRMQFFVESEAESAIGGAAEQLGGVVRIPDVGSFTFPMGAALRVLRNWLRGRCNHQETLVAPSRAVKERVQDGVGIGNADLQRIQTQRVSGGGRIVIDVHVGVDYVLGNLCPNPP